MTTLGYRLRTDVDNFSSDNIEIGRRGRGTYLLDTIDINYAYYSPEVSVTAYGDAREWMVAGPLQRLLLWCLLERPPLEEVEAELARLGIVKLEVD